MPTMVTDLTHYLDVTPLPIDAHHPRRFAERLGGFFGSIVEAVTAGFERGAAVYTTVRCRRRPGRKPCAGLICGILEPEEGVIVWACTRCGDNGYIHHYQGTPWDMTLMRPLETAEVGLMIRVIVTPDEHACMSRAVAADAIVDRLLKAARVGIGPEDIVITGPRVWVERLRNAVAMARDDAQTAGVVFPLTSALGKLGRATPSTWEEILQSSEFGLYSTFDTQGYALDDGEARHAAHPTAFWIPDSADRESLTAGRLVKLIFAIQTDTADDIAFERMWVVVETRTGDIYQGRLDNQPVSSQTLAVGDVVFFGPEHVIDIARESLEYS
jgi:hypothetical protein